MTRDTFDKLCEAVRTGDLRRLEPLLAEDVHWYGPGPGAGCQNRKEVIAWLGRRLEPGVTPRLDDARLEGDRALLEIGLAPGTTARLAFTLDEAGRVTELQGYSSATTADHDLALRARGPAGEASDDARVSGLIPFVNVRDVARSVAFYRLLGLELSDTHAPGGRLVWAAMTNDTASIMLAEGAPPEPRAQGVLFYLYSRDLASLRDHLVAHGLTPGEIVDGTPGPKQEMRVTDPDGYCLMVAQV